MQEGGLTTSAWATIVEYEKLLQPFAETTKVLEGRGAKRSHGALWEVLVIFEYLLNALERLKDDVKKR